MTEQYQVYWYPGDIQQKGRRKFMEYVGTLKDPEFGASVSLEESTVMMLERMNAKATQQLGGHLYRSMAIVEWAPARTVIGLKTLLSIPKEEYDSKGITREGLYNRALAELNEMIEQVGRSTFLLTPDQVYSADYLRRKVLREIIEGLEAPKPIPHLYEKNGVITRPAISPVNLSADLLGSPLYAYPGGKTGTLRAVTLAEIAITPGILKDYVPEKIRVLRGWGADYKDEAFDKTMYIHGPGGSGYIQEMLGGLVRSIDTKLIRDVDVTGLTQKTKIPVSENTKNAIEYIVKLGLVPVEVIWYVFGPAVQKELDESIASDLGFIIRHVGSVYLTRRRIATLDLKATDALLMVVFSNIVEIWRRVLPWLWGDKEKYEKLKENGKMSDFLETMAVNTFKIAQALKDIYNKGNFTAQDPIERTIVGYLRDRGLVITPPLSSADYCEINMGQSEYLRYMLRVCGEMA
jgi:hypothetical protein